MHNWAPALVLFVNWILLLCFPSNLSALQQTPKWELVRTATIGSLDDPDTSLSLIGGAVVTTGGEIWVTQPLEGRVRRFSREGVLLGMIGRPGQGPGDLGMPESIQLVEGRVAIDEPSNRRISIFRLDGTFERTISADEAFAGSSFPIRPWAVLANGSFVGLTTASAGEAMAGASSLLGTVFISNLAEGGRARTVTTFQDRNRFLLNRRVDGVMAFRYPFDHERTHLAAAPDGGAIVLAEASWSGTPGVRVARFAPSGANVFDVTIPRPPPLLPPGTRDAVHENIIDAAIRTQLFGDRRTASEALLEVVGDVRHYPPVAQVVASADGHTWVRVPVRANTEGDLEEEWLVLSEAGRLVASIRHPPSSQLLYVNTSEALFGRVAEFDVPYLDQYTIRYR